MAIFSELVRSIPHRLYGRSSVSVSLFARCHEKSAVWHPRVARCQHPQTPQHRLQCNSPLPGLATQNVTVYMKQLCCRQLSQLASMDLAFIVQRHGALHMLDKGDRATSFLLVAISILLGPHSEKRVPKQCPCGANATKAPLFQSGAFFLNNHVCRKKVPHNKEGTEIAPQGGTKLWTSFVISYHL